MRTTAIALLLIASASPAFAHGYGDSGNRADNRSNSDSRSTSRAASAADSQSNNAVDYQNHNAANTAFAAPLAVGSDSCMGSTSVGGQSIGFGLSLGSTWHDEGCERRKDAVTMNNLGERNAAVALMCQDSKVAAAMKAAGHPCPVVVVDAGDSKAWPSGAKAIDR